MPASNSFPNVMFPAIAPSLPMTACTPRAVDLERVRGQEGGREEGRKGGRE